MIRRRRNYLPSLVLIIVLWSLLGLMLVYVEPELVKDILIPNAYLPFFLLFFPASFFTSAIIWGSTRRGLLTSLGITGFLFLRVFQMGNILNLLLILGILIAVDRYLS